MTDTIQLKDILKKSGYKKSFVATKLGLTYQGFYNKVNNRNDFTATEMFKLCHLLDIKPENREDIFFAQCVENTSTK